MNASSLKALFFDALYQVLDNWVFRILCALVLLPVLATFVLGFEETGISLLFGWKHWTYESILRAFGGGSGDVGQVRKDLIEGLLRFVFQQYAGNIGVIFCIAATAFFVPRMIEKGAADVLFHKPLGRLVLYLSRYLAGLLFVGLLSAALVVGMYAGLRLVSGHDDPGILWAAPLLVYLFGMIYAVSMLAGVVTRSTVAATLLTVMFFFGNGCVHLIWVIQEAGPPIREISSAVSAADGEAEDPAADESEEGSPDDTPALLRALQKGLVVAHYLLPKTMDADILAAQLRRATERRVFEDPDLGLRIVDLPAGYRPVERGQREPAPPGLGEILGEARFQARQAEGDGRIDVWRRERRTLETPRANGTVRQREERLGDAVDALIEALEVQPGTTSVERRSDGDSGGARSPLGAVQVRAEREDGVLHAYVLRTGEHVYTLAHAGSGPSAEQDLAHLREACQELKPVSEGGPAEYYAAKLRLDAPWRFNPLFSVGSSVLFTVVVLLLGWARLQRIDF